MIEIIVTASGQFEADDLNGKTVEEVLKMVAERWRLSLDYVEDPFVLRQNLNTGTCSPISKNGMIRDLDSSLEMVRVVLPLKPM